MNSMDNSSLLLLHKTSYISFYYMDENGYESTTFYNSWLDSCIRPAPIDLSLIVRETVDVFYINTEF